MLKVLIKDPQGDVVHVVEFEDPRIAFVTLYNSGSVLFVAEIPIEEDDSGD